MNAGCFGKEFKDVLLSIQVIDKLGNVFTIPKKDINFEYRNSNLNDDLIFLSASFEGLKSSSTKIREETKTNAKVELEPKLEGRQAIMILAPEDKISKDKILVNKTWFD